MKKLVWKKIVGRRAQTIQHGVHLFKNRRTLWQMLREVWQGKYRMSFLTTAIVFISLAYVIFPFDIIPDFIPVIGWLDDGLIVYLMVKRLHVETQRYNRFKVMQRRSY